MKHLIEEQLILYYYGEAEDESSIEEHLTSCDSCRADFQELKRILAAVDTFPVPERSADYGSEVWNRLRPQLRARSRFRWPPFLRPQRLAWAGAMATVVMVAFFLGRFWPRPEAPTAEQKAPPQMMPAQIRERVLLASVADHLERSQMILLDLSHVSGNHEIDISADQAWAQELLAENRIYRQSALKSGEVGTASVLEDLERILLEIANSPSRITSAELAEIRQRIEAQGIIFKLRVIGSSMRQKQDEAARELARRSS
jgi:predicted anti-sigma-YlaC factor YlaD